MSKNTKRQLIRKAKSAYGDNFKTALAKDLGVDVSTVRRIFNRKGGEIPALYVVAINKVCDEKLATQSS